MPSMDEAAEDFGRFGGAEHIGKPYLEVGFTTMLRKRGGWLAYSVFRRNAHRQRYAIL